MLNILLLEDNKADQALIEWEIDKAGIDSNIICVETKDSFIKELGENPDLILSDYALPQFNGMEALRIMQEAKKEIPFIIVTGTLDEETAVNCLKSGAMDYVLKDKIFRLPSAILRALDIWKMRFEKRQAEQELRLSQHQLRLIIDAVPALIGYVDRDQNLKFGNKTHEKWFSAEFKDIRGRSFSAVLGDANFDSVLPYAKKALGGEFVEFSTLLHMSDFIRHVNATFIPDMEGAYVKGYIYLITDISEIKQTEEKLKAATLAAQSANMAKSQFLTNMSHEIRTPLNAILGFGELLLEPEVTASERIEWVSKIRSNGDHLKEIIDEILDLSKVELNQLRAKKESFSLSELMMRIQSQMSLLLHEKNLSLVYKVKNLIPDRITSDALKIRQILVNLIGNSIKFSEQGTISVELELLKRGTKKYLKFSVEDQGIGIDPKNIGLLFNPFTQADSSLTRRYGGAGIGLALSARLTEALGGKLEVVRSVPGEGSTFAFTIDIEPFDSSSMITSLDMSLKKEEQRLSIDLTNLKVLVVEDLVDNQDLFRHFLKEAGALVDTADDGREGVQKAMSGDYDVVLMDIQMPVLDGYEAISYLRSHGYQKPIIALTAHAMKEEKEKCLRYGCNGHLAKPVLRQRLLEEVAHHIPH